MTVLDPSSVFSWAYLSAKYSATCSALTVMAAATFIWVLLFLAPEAYQNFQAMCHRAWDLTFPEDTQKQPDNTTKMCRGVNSPWDGLWRGDRKRNMKGPADTFSPPSLWQFCGMLQMSRAVLLDWAHVSAEEPALMHWVWPSVVSRTALLYSCSPFFPTSLPLSLFSPAWVFSPSTALVFRCLFKLCVPGNPGWYSDLKY